MALDQRYRVSVGDADIDPHYTMTVSRDLSFPGPDAITVNATWPIQAGVWVLNGPNSRWIGPQANQGRRPARRLHLPDDLRPHGCGCDKDPADGRLGHRQLGTDILLNGTSTGLQNMAQFGRLTPSP